MDNTILTLILFLKMDEAFKMTLSRTQPEVSKNILQGEQLKYRELLSNKSHQEKKIMQ